MRSLRITAMLATLVLAACAQVTNDSSAGNAAARNLSAARKTSAPPEERAALYLQAAAQSTPGHEPAQDAGAATETYNAASAELTVLLRSAEGGRLWNHPLSLTADGSSYRLRFEPGSKGGVWRPDFFTAFVPAEKVPISSIKRRDVQQGVGGALVGIRKETPLPPFTPFVGVTAPVTATLDFKAHDATLTLRDPSMQPKARVAGATRPLAADFSAPLAYYPHVNETIAGLAAALSVSSTTKRGTGLYMLQPYDPERIPVIFVHGLISTARMWRNVINEIELDPQLRGRFQYWVFQYPTGDPVAYSALQFREQLAKAQKLYGFPHGFVLVAHSMGGIVSRMQAATVTQAGWEHEAGTRADVVFKDLPKDGIVYRSIVFNANPHIRRIIFICTPHRGSEMALGGLGQIATRLISLPSDLTRLRHQLGNGLAVFTGDSKRLPNSIFSLSPKNPMLKVVNAQPIQALHHTILGDRGKGDSPNSSDGVVPYWSSHLDDALSQKIVPGPHGLCEFPQTIAEVKRILLLDFKAGDHSRASMAPRKSSRPTAQYNP